MAGASRQALQAATNALRIFEAWSDEPWVNDGAAVRVSLVCFSRVDDSSVSDARLNDQQVQKVYADLTAGSDLHSVDLTQARRLSENADVAFMGHAKGGPFDISGDLAREWMRLPANPNGRTNADVLKPWMNGMDLTKRSAGKWIVDFGWTMSDRQGSAVRGTLPMDPGTRLSDAPAEPTRTASQIVVPAYGPAAKDVAENRRPVALRGNGAGRQIPAVCVVRCPHLSGSATDRDRPR